MARTSFAGKVVVVTGASGGIGRATAVAFGRERAKVGLLARGEDGLDAARRDIIEAGGEAIAVTTDVADAGQVEAAAERVERELGPIDVWVNDAMATVFSPVHQIEPAEFKRATEVTYLGAVYGTMAALKRMKARDAGTIVQVGSALGYQAIPLQSAYCGAKYALRGFTDSLRCELIHDASPVRLTMVHLSAFNTPQFDWGRNRFGKRPQPVPPIFQPELAADGILWAARRPVRERWVGLPAVQLILGNRLAPWLMERMLANKAYGGQFTSEDEPQGRPDNLFSPVAGDFGPHGRFDERAKARSWQLVLSKHRAWLAAAALVVAMAIGGAAIAALA